MHARIQIYWCRSYIFRHLKLELLTQFPASNDEKYINVVYIWRKFVSFYGYVHWRMTTEISVMYGSEKVNVLVLIQSLDFARWKWPSFNRHTKYKSFLSHDNLTLRIRRRGITCHWRVSSRLWYWHVSFRSPHRPVFSRLSQIPVSSS